MSLQTFIDERDHVAEIRRQIKRFVAAEAPREKRALWDREHRFPRDAFRRLADLGVMGLTIDEAHGGAGQDIVAAVAVIEELCRAGPFLAGPYIHAAFYGGMNLSENGSESQKRELLPKLARGEMTFAYGLSDGYDMERHVRDLLGMPIVGGSSDMQRNNLASLWRLGR